MSMKILDASGRMGGAPFSASELQREQITEAPASATLEVRGFRCHRRSLARDVLLHIFYSFLDDFLHIAEGLLRLAFILFGETLDLLISAANHLPGLFLHLAGDLFDLTLDLILVHDISFEIMERMSSPWATPMAQVPTIRCGPRTQKLGHAPRAAMRWIKGPAHGLPLMQIMDRHPLH